jgi:hypothetical protein
MRDQFFFRRAHSIFQYNECGDFFTIERIRNSDCSGRSDCRMRVENFINFARIDVLAAANDHVGFAIDDVKKAVLVAITNIACVKPSATKRALGRLRVFEVSLQNIFARSTISPSAPVATSRPSSINHSSFHFQSACRMSPGASVRLED